MKEFLTITAAVVTAQMIRPILLAALWTIRDKTKRLQPIQVYEKKRFGWIRAWVQRSVDCY